MTWLDNQIKDLEETNSKFKEQISKIKNVQPEIVNNFQEATPLKLENSVGLNLPTIVG